MFATALCLTLLAQPPQVVTRGGPAPVPENAPATLPDTPQGRRVKAYIDVFNAGDEQKFLKAQEELMASETLAKRPAADRAKMHNRLKGDFGTFKVKRAVATAEQIRVVIPDKDGNEAIFSFDFEAKAPYKIKSIGIRHRPRRALSRRAVEWLRAKRRLWAQLRGDGCHLAPAGWCDGSRWRAVTFESTASSTGVIWRSCLARITMFHAASNFFHPVA